MGFCCFRGEDNGILFPVFTVYLNLFGFIYIMLIIDEVDTEFNRSVSYRTGIEGQIVLLSSLNTYALKTFIIQSGSCQFLIKGKAGIMRILIKTGRLCLYGHITERSPASERILKLERAVFDQFRIQSAIRTEIYIFKKDTVHGGLNRCTRLLHVYFKLIGLCHQAAYPHT